MVDWDALNAAHIEERKRGTCEFVEIFSDEEWLIPLFGATVYLRMSPEQRIKARKEAGQNFMALAAPPWNAPEYLEGIQARQRGVKKNKCPYDRREPSGTAWLIGWTEAPGLEHLPNPFMRSKLA